MTKIIFLLIKYEMLIIFRSVTFYGPFLVSLIYVNSNNNIFMAGQKEVV